MLLLSANVSTPTATPSGLSTLGPIQVHVQRILDIKSREAVAILKRDSCIVLFAREKDRTIACFPDVSLGSEFSELGPAVSFRDESIKVYELPKSAWARDRAVTSILNRLSKRFGTLTLKAWRL